MYEFLTGPAAWISFGIFFVGLIIRITGYVRGLDWKLDRVTYTQNVGFGIKGALRSVAFWLFPFGTRSWRSAPVFTIMVFLFHVCLVMTPVFLLAHNLILKEKWGVSFWTLPETVADGLTIAVIIAGVFFILRRIALAEVRILTTAYDIGIICVAIIPFITGYVAHHQVYDYKFWLYAHIISGEILLMVIPFTRLSHFVLFFLSRMQLGMDFGIKRGGMKGKGMAW